jgi:hypothetical protein
MSNKPEHTNYFREIIRRLKKMESESTEDPKHPDDRLYGELGDRIEFMELPFPPEMFDRLSAEEKETLYIWLNRRNIPQA